MEDMGLKEFYKDKKVLITGHTGFKGSWLTKILSNWGADIAGYSLNPPTILNLYDTLDVDINSVIGDIRDYDKIFDLFDAFKPEIVIHMAAQPLVLESYKNPKSTYEINVNGTVNVCEAVRKTDCVKSFVNVTTDKVYENLETAQAYCENDKLNGYDPYSNSKSCSDIITQSYFKSFLRSLGISTSTVRSGNVIGGGDFSPNRIVPDCIRAALDDEVIFIRHPESIRPYQHVLEPLNLYLIVAMKQYEDISYSSSYNIGPNKEDCVETLKLVELFAKYWEGFRWDTLGDSGPHEAKFLHLDSTKIKEEFNWAPRWNIDTAISKTVEWAKAYKKNKDTNKIIDNQIKEFYT